MGIDTNTADHYQHDIRRCKAGCDRHLKMRSVGGAEVDDLQLEAAEHFHMSTTI